MYIPCNSQNATITIHTSMYSIFSFKSFHFLESIQRKKKDFNILLFSLFFNTLEMTHKMQLSVTILYPIQIIFYTLYIYLLTTELSNFNGTIQLQRNYHTSTAIFYTLFGYPRNDPQNAVIGRNFLPYIYTHIYTQLYTYFCTFCKALFYILFDTDDKPCDPILLLLGIYTKEEKEFKYILHTYSAKPYSIYTLARR